MNVSQFKASLEETAPPADLSPLLQALWWDARGEWDRAHHLAQDEESTDAAWVHAYLHRKEGDPGNASYWYRRAGRAPCPDSLDAEWESQVAALLEGGA